MTLGLGVFLGAVVIASVFLYSVTKDRWRWGTWFKRIVLTIVILIVVAIVGYYGLNWYNNQPKPFLSLDDIKLGESPEDVRFEKGAPSVICDNSKDDTYVVWSYAKTLITFKKGYGVTSASLHDIKVSENGEPFRYPELGDVTQFDSLEYINGRYGPPTHIASSKDGLSRIYSYAKYKLRVEFAQQRVTWYGIYTGNQADTPEGTELNCHDAPEPAKDDHK